jgi:flagellar assembly protein FliH
VKEEISLSDNVVIKSEDVLLVTSVRSSPSGFAKIPISLERGGRSRKKGGNGQEDLKKEFEEKLRVTQTEVHAQGYAEGHEAGTRAEEEKLRSAVDAVSKALQEIVRLKKEVMEASEKQVLCLAFSIAEKILHGEAAVNRDAVASVLRAAMKGILDKEGLKIRLSPMDYHHLTHVNPGAIRHLEGLRNVTLEEDGTIGPGGVIIETLFGEVDARIDHQLEEIKDFLLKKDAPSSP